MSNHTATSLSYSLSLPTLFRSRTSPRLLKDTSAPFRSGCVTSRNDVPPLAEAVDMGPDALHLPAARRARSSPLRSEEHTSELQSREKLVCRLLHEKKNYKTINY